MSWQKELDELAKRREMSRQMGGKDKLARQKARGKLNARERLEGLLDFDGFDEIGALAGKGRYTEDGEFIDSAPSNFIYGRGRINGRPLSRPPMISPCGAGRRMPRSTVNLSPPSKWRMSCACRLSG